MASVLAIGVFNAVAFAGAGFLLNKLNHSDYEKEIKHHNEAMEKLLKAKEKWYEEQVNNKEKIEMHKQSFGRTQKNNKRTCFRGLL